jgi:hypothetical protein
MGCSGSRPNVETPNQAPAVAVEEVTLTPATIKKNSATSASNHLILSKFATINFGSLLDGNLPQLIVGRVGGMVSDLRTPYNSSLCALYRIDIQVQTGDRRWEQRYTEVKSADFYLVDPQSPKERLYICGNDYVIEFISKQIDPPSAEAGSGAGFSLVEERSPQIRALFQRAGIAEDSVARIREEIHDINTQLAVFGVVESGHPVYGKSCRRLVPVLLPPEEGHSSSLGN